jgi:hypothetical protein
MGMFDKLKDQASGLKKKATQVVDQNSDTIHTGIDKAGEFVDQKTKGKYADKVHKAKGAAEKGLDKLDGKDDDFAGQATSEEHAHEHAHGADPPHTDPHEHSDDHTHDHPQP